MTLQNKKKPPFLERGILYLKRAWFAFWLIEPGISNRGEMTGNLCRMPTLKFRPSSEGGFPYKSL